MNLFTEEQAAFQHYREKEGPVFPVHDVCGV